MDAVVKNIALTLLALCPLALAEVTVTVKPQNQTRGVEPGPLGFGNTTVTEKQGSVAIAMDGQLFTEYRYGDAPHVYYYPVIGPSGAKMTRAFPMEKAEGEETDHPHHRSIWFSHGDVNGVDFWTEHAGVPKHPAGRIEHDAIVKAEGGKESGFVTSTQKWIAPDGVVHLRSSQVLRVYATPASERVVDFEVTLIAGEKDAVFGDTKEGAAGIRIAESMRLKQPKGPGKGSIVNSEGDTDAKAWGKKSKWVTMTGPVGEKTYSITMMDHPSNLRHPTRWHARDYGLFAANPFCEAEMDKSQPKGSGKFTLSAGKSLTLKYRIVFTEGEAAAAKAAERFAAWK